MKRIFLILLILLLVTIARGNDSRTFDNGKTTQLVTIENVECTGTNRAIVVCILGMEASSVKFGDTDLPKLCFDRTEMGYGCVAIYGVQLGDGHAIADVVAEVENSRYCKVIAYSLSNVNQLSPFTVLAAAKGYDSPITLAVENTSSRERIVGGISFFELTWAHIRILNLLTNAVGNETRTTISVQRYQRNYWVAAHVLISPKDNSSVTLKEFLPAQPLPKHLRWRNRQTQ